MNKAKTIAINKVTLTVVGVLVVIALMFAWFGSNNQIAQAQKTDESGITISISNSLATQLMALIAGIFGGQDEVPSVAVGGSTSSDWNVGGNLSIAGETSLQGLTQGGGCFSTTTVSATDTWTEAEMLANNCFVYSGPTSGTSLAITITLPATSTMTTLIPNAGDTRQWFYDPSGYVAATTTTFAAGTGIILMEPNDGDDSNVVIAGATSAAMITLMRRSDTDVYAVIEEISDAD